MNIHLPGLESDSILLQRAFRVALGDVLGNMVPVRVQTGDERTILMAGLTYESWTRDAAISAWNGLPAFWPEVSRDTLLSEVDVEGGLRGQYWDAIVWVTGAWQHYLWTGDRGFLAEALKVSEQWMLRMEREEMDGDGLFRGAACYQDGVSGYGDRYAECGGSSCIADWPQTHPLERAQAGAGLPMKCLSTNCLYFNACGVIERMRSALDLPADRSWSVRAGRLRAAIEERFIQGRGESMLYYLDPDGEDSRQEGMGYALAILFDLVADPLKLVRSVRTMPAGLPGLWPGYERYESLAGGGRTYGRHCGLVWPHVQALWAEACLKCGEVSLGHEEIARLEQKAVRDGNFFECYHPETGLPDGGVQEINPEVPEDWHAWCLIGNPDPSRSIRRWRSQPRTTWGATGYLRCCLHGYLGLRPEEEQLIISPRFPAGFSRVRLAGLRWREAVLNLTVVAGSGHRVRLDGAEVSAIPAGLRGCHNVYVETPQHAL